MKSAFALAGLVLVSAGSAYAQPVMTLEACQEELLAHLGQQGIEPTGIQAGSTVTIRGETFIVPLRATPDTLCEGAIREFAQEQERSSEITAATSRATTAEEALKEERRRAELYFSMMFFFMAATIILLPFVVIFLILVIKGLIAKREKDLAHAHFAKRAKPLIRR